MNRILYILLTLLFTSSWLYSQDDKVIRGIVYDEVSGETVIGATIAEYNADGRVINGSTTDYNGRFTIKYMSKGNTLQISFIGYETEKILISNQRELKIFLSPQAIAMEGAVIIGKAIDPLTGMSDEDETGATSTTMLRDLDNLGALSSADALQGQVSGLDIVASSGNPGSGSQLVIRGLGSLGNANPLIVVDGIPRNVSTSDLDLASADQEDIGALISVAPQDIRSIKVLKDAASTAVWGSRGANGVILIETIKGDKGNISYFYNYQVSLNIEPDPIPMLNGDEYITMQLEELLNEQGVFDVPPELAYDPTFYNFHNYNKNIDWLDAVTQNGFKDEHYFKISGGGNKVLFFTSLRYLKSKGTTINTSFDQIGTRVNLNYAMSNKLRFTVNFDYSSSNKGDNIRLRSSNLDLVTAYQDESESEYSQSFVNIRKMAYLKAPNMSIWEYDEEGQATGEYFTPIDSYQGTGDEYYNPVAIGNLSNDDLRRNDIQNSFKLDYNFGRGIRFIETVSFNYKDNKINQFIPYSSIGVDWLDNQVNNSLEENSFDNRILSRSQLFIRPKLKNRNHEMSTVLLWEMEQDSYNRVTLRTAKSGSVLLRDPASDAPIISMRSVSGTNRKVGALGNFNYKYKDRYLLTVNMRADASSIFGENNRWALFPSLSLAWKLHQEPWMQGVSQVDNAKLRMSWGRSGNTRGNSTSRHGLYDTEGQYLGQFAIEQTQVQLTNFQWETKTSYNIGFDLAMFANRFTMTFDLYDAVTDNLLWRNYEIPLSSGYDLLRFFNGGSIQNRGWELLLNGVVLRSGDMDLSMKFNVARNSNSFLSFPENFNTERSINIGNGDYPRRVTLGQPIGSFYGFRYLGVYPTDDDAYATDANGDYMVDLAGNRIPMRYKDEYQFKGGDAKYEDVNHDGRIDINDAVYLGDGNPDFMGGFGLSYGWKQLKFSAQFHYRLGFDIVNEVALQTEGMNNRNNQSLAVLHRWRRQGQDEEGILPRAYMNHPANNLGSDRYVMPGDYLRLNNLSLQYSLPARAIVRLNLKSVRIGLNLRKILTFTNYTGQDPEISRAGSDPFWLGTDNAKTPVPKMYTMSVAVGF